MTCLCCGEPIILIEVAHGDTVSEYQAVPLNARPQVGHRHSDLVLKFFDYSYIIVVDSVG